MTFFEYLNSQSISYVQKGEDIAEIDGKTYKFCEPKNDVHFDEEFKLIHSNLGYDFHVIYFGGRFYYIPMGEEDKFELKELKYIGAHNSILETDCFLGVHGSYEILSGSRSFKDWIAKAKWLGCSSLGLADKNTLAGLMKFQAACDSVSIKPILGATFSVVNVNGKEYDVKLYIKDYQGWINLLTINKLKNVDGLLKESNVLENEEGLAIVLDPKTMSYEDTLAYEFLDKVYFMIDTVEYEDSDRDKEYLENLQEFLESQFKPLPYGDAFYLDKEDSYIKTKLSEMSGAFDYKTDNQHFKSRDEYYNEFADLFMREEDMMKLFSEALDNEKELVDSCNFKIALGERHLPAYELTEEELEKYGDKETMFFSLIEEGLNKLYPDFTQVHLDRIEEEVKVLQKAMVIDYFLNTRDIIQYAKNNNILYGYGRGSASGSIISYLLGIVYVDPIEFKLLFSRFLNEGRIGDIEDGTIIEIELEDGTTRRYSEDETILIKVDGKLTPIKVMDLKEGDEV